MGNIFEHDAVPTWSGFVYQGRIAVYLAVKKLLKLKQSGSMDEIQHYSIEMEKCEDIAILIKKQSKEEYISIHQVKNYEHTAISKYREAAVQLMLEAGYYKEHGQGRPKAYLHVAKPLRTVNRSTSASIVFDGWASSVLDLFVDLGKWYSDLSSNNNVDEVFSNIESCDFEKILGINRSQLQGIIKSLTDSCKKKKQDNAEKYLGELIEFCKDELCVPRLVRDIELYEYSSGVAYCSGPDIYNKVFECVKEYKDASGLNNEQLEYLTNAIFCFVSDTILERHRLLQDKKPAPCSIPLEEFAKILDGSVENYEKKGNLYALRRLYNDAVEQYCINCKEDNGGDCTNSECKLQKPEYRVEQLKDDEFVKLCYCLNPECVKEINNRECLADLLNKDGLLESVFPVIRDIDEEKFLKTNYQFAVVNELKNAFLTAIMTARASQTVNNIVKALETNKVYIETIFEADQLVTARLSEPSSIWDKSCIEIRADELEEAETKAVKTADDDSNSIFVSKRPEFIKCEHLLENMRSEE